MKTLQTGTKVLIEATVIAEDYHDNNLSVRVELPNDMKIWIDPSDLTVCETAEPIDLSNFCIDITDPVNAELLPGFKEWLNKQPCRLGSSGNFKFWWSRYGMVNGKADCSAEINSVPLTTLPELQKQHPGVFGTEPPEESWENKMDRAFGIDTPSFKAGQEVPKHGDKIHALKVSEWVDAIYCCPHPNQTSALKHIVTDVDSVITWSTSAIRPIPAQPTVESELERVLAIVYDKSMRPEWDKGKTVSFYMGVVRDIINRHDSGHQKHSGRVDVSVEKQSIFDQISKELKPEFMNSMFTWKQIADAITKVEFIARKDMEVSVPSDEEILDVYMKTREGSTEKEVIATVRHFMTRKGQQGNG